MFAGAISQQTRQKQAPLAQSLHFASNARKDLTSADITSFSKEVPSRPKRSSDQLAVFFAGPAPYVYKGVTITCDDAKKRQIMEQGIDIALNAGHSLAGLKMYVTPKYDKELKSHEFGFFRKDKGDIIFRSNVDWKETADGEAAKYPVWANNTYAGRPVHLVLHELAHFLHHKKNAASYNQANNTSFNTATKQLLTNALGHPYPAQNPAELIAEMFPRKSVGRDNFIARANQLYETYDGP